MKTAEGQSDELGIFEEANGLLPNLVLALVFGFYTNALRVLPQDTTRNDIAGNELDFN